ncbi:Elongation factor 1-alpha 1, partial [Galemys pyrenaicus]
HTLYLSKFKGLTCLRSNKIDFTEPPYRQKRYEEIVKGVSTTVGKLAITVTLKRLNIVVTGHINSSWSNTTGPLVCNCGGIDKRTSETFEEEAAEAVKGSFKQAWSWKIGYNPDTVAFVPISVLGGDDTLEPRANMPSPKDGRSHVQRAVPVEPTAWISGCIRPLPSKVHTCPSRVSTQLVGSGLSLCAVHLALASVVSKVKSVEMHHKGLSEALPGTTWASVSSTCITGVCHGSMAGDSKNDPPRAAAGFTTQVVMLNHPSQMPEMHLCCISAELKEKIVILGKSERQPKLLNLVMLPWSIWFLASTLC